MAIVNGKAYDWDRMDIKLSGFPNIDFQEISYDDELEKELTYGKGHMPRGYGTGNYKAGGKMTLLRDDYDDILDYCKRNGVSIYSLQIPKIIVNYAKADGRIHTDVINTVSFSKVSNSGAQGDKSLKVDIDLFIAGQIVRDGVAAV